MKQAFEKWGKTDYTAAEDFNLGQTIMVIILFLCFVSAGCYIAFDTFSSL
jgi:hypothetical protein